MGLYKLAKTLKQLETEEVVVLRALEKLANRFEFAPVDEITIKSLHDVDDVLFRLGRLNKIGLVQRSTKPYLGYRLSRGGYDALALYELAEQDIIVSIGQPYGVGKEASVFRALDAKEQEVAVKFLRWGRTSFRQVRRLRTLSTSYLRSWIDYCKQAAVREFTALKILTNHNVSVPKPIAVNRHVLVMSHMEGELLLQVADLQYPRRVQKSILNQVRIAFQDAHVIHGDLSEYNIFIDEEDQVTLFDWPQWQTTSHPNALLLIKRDVSHVLKFFKRQFRLSNDLQQILQQIIGDQREEIRK